MSRHPSALRALLTAAAFALTGCYSYIPVQPAMIRPGDELRLHLTREGMFDLPDLPAQSGGEVNGKLVSSAGGSFMLRVPVGVQSYGLLARMLDQQVHIAPSQVIQLERRELSRSRTALAVVGGVVGAVAIAKGFGTLGAPNPETPEKPVDPEAGVSLLGLLGIHISVP
jgi:hypothetical protein